MASIDKVGNRWRVRWREVPGGRQSMKVFRQESAAKRFRTEVEHSLLHGTYVDPISARATLGEYVATTWLPRMRPTWRPATAQSVEKSLRIHVLPTFGPRPLVTIKRADVEAWAVALQLAPSTVATVRQHLGQVLVAAVEDGLIPRNPAAGARMPKVETVRVRPIDPDVRDAIAAQLPGWLRPAVVLGAGAGLRQAEVAGLLVENVDFLRRRLTIAHQLISPDSGPCYVAPAKTERSHRTIPVDDVVLEELARHLDGAGRGRRDFVLRTPPGLPVRRQRFAEAWRGAAARAGAPGVVFHDLRHTFASTLLSAGVSIKAVSEWLGHASATVTLETYAHLMPVDDDRGREAIRAAFTRRDSPLVDGPSQSY